MKKQLWSVALLAVLACGDDSGGGGDRPDARPPAGDAGADLDASTMDARVDASTPAVDARVDARADATTPTVEAGSPTDDATVPAPTCDATSAPMVPALALTSVVSGRDRLVYAAQPKGSNDWYLVHQKGRIDVLVGGQVRPTAFLNLSASITQALDVNDERGLLGLAFPDDYASSGKFYVAMTPTEGADANRDLVLEFTRSADPFVADPATRKVIVALEVSAGNHNGGNVIVGPDGMLYVGTGDGGGGCNSDKPNTPQQPGSLFGKILRLDPRAAAPYGASGNPFSGASGDARVLHYGLRNPFRFGFDAMTGDLYIADVGQTSYEEVSFAPAGSEGLNFGWPAFEGDHGGTCGGSFQLAAGSQHTAPIVDIDVRDNAPGSAPFRDYVSIINGPVYRGSAIPALRGVLLFGDYKGIRMGALRQCGARTSPIAPIRKVRSANETGAYFTLPDGQTFGDLTAIVADGAGELYFVANRSTLFKLVPGS